MQAAFASLFDYFVLPDGHRVVNRSCKCNAAMAEGNPAIYHCPLVENEGLLAMPMDHDRPPIYDCRQLPVWAFVLLVIAVTGLFALALFWRP